MITPPAEQHGLLQIKTNLYQKLCIIELYYCLRNAMILITRYPLSASEEHLHSKCVLSLFLPKIENEMNRTLAVSNKTKIFIHLIVIFS